MSSRTGKPWRIAYCEGNLDGTIGGSYFSLLYLVSGLDRAEFEPIAVFRRDHEFLNKYRDAGIRTVVLPINIQTRATGAGEVKSGYGPSGTISKKFHAAINFFRLFVLDSVRVAWWLSRNRIRLVHLNNSVTRLHSWMLAARLLRIPCISHERGLNKEYSTMARYFATRLDRVVCISRAVQDNLKLHCVTWGNTVVIYNGLDPAMFQPSRSASDVRRELGIEEASPLIGMIGNIREWKGQDVVIRAMACLLRENPDLNCLFVGGQTASDRPFRAELDRLAEELGVSDHIVFAGYRDDPANYMNIMDIVIHASVDPEPFGRVLIEAMSLGKPVVGARAGAVPEILDVPGCGLTFSPGNHLELCQLVGGLLSNEDARVNMGLAAKKRACEQFGISRNISETQSIYRQVLENRQMVD